MNITPPKAVTELVHKRTHFIKLDPCHVNLALAHAAAECVEHSSPSVKAPHVTYSVVIKDFDEGNYCAEVTIVEDLSPREP